MKVFLHRVSDQGEAVFENVVLLDQSGSRIL